MSRKPAIGMIRTLDDCIRALNVIRNYFNEPDDAALTTANVNDSKDRRYVTDAQLARLEQTTSASSPSGLTTITMVDAGGTSQTGKIQIRYMGDNPDGSKNWQLEVV